MIKFQASRPLFVNLLDFSDMPAWILPVILWNFLTPTLLKQVCLFDVGYSAPENIKYSIDDIHAFMLITLFKYIPR